MNSDIIIRPTVSADITVIGSLAEVTELFPANMLPGMVSGYLDGSKADLWLTAECPSGIVGFAFCEPERLTNGTWNLLAIAIAPELQGRGIGAQVLRHLEDELREGGHRILLVETLGTPEFERTRVFYLKNGFVQEARVREFYDVGGDKIIFWKHL